jgi:2-polyprenyl-3-methyl-5-hydroxy-6-metoxy-1,4-benzoquinol methylase
MYKQEYKNMFALEDTYWWFVARRKMVINLLRQYVKNRENISILDIGCGTGNNLIELSKLGQAIGLDDSQEAIDFCRQRGLYDVVKQNAEEINLSDNSFNVITMLDVLEHVQDDNKVLNNCYNLCKKDGLMLITVPAYGFLWSEHDEALQHKRRYTASELRNKLILANFKIIKLSYTITSLFFPIFFIRLWQSIFKDSTHPQTSIVLLPKLINNFIIKILDFENSLLRFINYPIGVSIVCLATKL